MFVVILGIIIMLVILAAIIWSVRREKGYGFEQFDPESTDDRSKVLTHLNTVAIQFVECLKTKYFNTSGLVDIDDADTDDKRKIYRLIERYNPTGLRETAHDSMSTSYNINKGDAIHMCLNERPDTDKLHDMNTLIFVMLHEMAHTATVEKQHVPPFWVTFKMLLLNAVDCGIYTPVDYAKHPITFCGLDVGHNPLFPQSNEKGI